jgi:hypothetical protein
MIQYVLTLVRRVEIWAQLPVDGVIGVVAVKLPCILAYALGAWLCAAGLKSVWGMRVARGAATAYALCMPVWYDAAVWGQWDSILCLALIAAAIAAVRDRPFWSGAATGLALATKFQAIVILPPLLIYGLRRWGPRGVATGVAGCAVAWVVTVAPMLLGGDSGWQSVRRPFASSVDFAPFQTVLTCNIWMIGQTMTPAARQWPSTFGRADHLPILGPMTAKQLGLALFIAYTAMLLIGLWRRPSPRRFVLAAGLLAFGLCMLATQIHERYVVASCALLALITGCRDGRRYYLAVTVPAAANIIIALGYLNATTGRHDVSIDDIAPYQPWLLVISLVNLASLVLTTIWYVRDTFGGVDQDGPVAGFVKEPRTQ